MTLISAIIPTHLRPQSVRQAACSALKQAGVEVEVIVVVDGRDDETQRGLASLGDGRLRVHVPPRRLGNAAARNAGVDLARGEWIAFLDDDDEWLPGKLAQQLATAEASAHVEPVVGCRVIARTGGGDLIWPRRLPREGEPIGDYLYRRSSLRSLFSGEGMLQTSMLLARRELLQRVPFSPGLRRHVDPDWLLRVEREPGVGFVFPPDPQPLAIWDLRDDRPRVSKTGGWRYSLAWAKKRRHLLSPRAYAGFLTGPASQRGATCSDRGLAFRSLLAEARRHGKLSPLDIAAHVANFAAGSGLRDRLVRLLPKRGRAQ